MSQYKKPKDEMCWPLNEFTEDFRKVISVVKDKRNTDVVIRIEDDVEEYHTKLDIPIKSIAYDENTGEVCFLIENIIKKFRPKKKKSSNKL